MTVAELIQALEKVKDKRKRVLIFCLDNDRECIHASEFESYIGIFPGRINKKRNYELVVSRTSASSGVPVKSG